MHVLGIARGEKVFNGLQQEIPRRLISHNNALLATDCCLVGKTDSIHENEVGLAFSWHTAFYTACSMELHMKTSFPPMHTKYIIVTSRLYGLGYTYYVSQQCLVTG